MKVVLLCIGKTSKNFLIEGEDEYVKRLKHYLKFEMKELPAVKASKNISEDEVKEKEAVLIQSYLKNGDTVILLDEKGKDFTSVGFSKFLQKQFNRGGQRLVFIVGGPYGFSDKIYKIAESKISLSKMTFSHQMIRLFFIEQLYRGMTILKGEPYHHE